MSGIFTVVGGRALMTTTLPVPAYGDGGKVYDQSGALYVADSAIVVSWANGCAFGSGGAMLIYDASLGMPTGVVYQNGLPFYQNRVCVDVLNAPGVVSGGTPFVPGGAVAAGGSGLTSGSGAGSLTTSFYAPLKTSLVPQTAAGSGVPTFTRATPAYVSDFEGVLRQAVSGEARFSGARRVQNWVSKSEAFDDASWLKLQGGTGVTPTVTAGFIGPTGAVNACRIQFDLGATPDTAGSRLFQGNFGSNAAFLRTRSIWLKSNTAETYTLYLIGGVGAYEGVVITVTPTWKRFSTVESVAGYNQIQFGLSGILGSVQVGVTTSLVADVLVFGAQVEFIPGSLNPAPSEYVSVGVLAAPWHGAGVDGVRYFSTANPNSVSGNVVTTNPAGGTAIPAATLLGYLAEGQRTNLCVSSQAFDDASNWVAALATVTANTAVAPDGTVTADTLTITGNGGNNLHQGVFNTTIGTTYTFSAYVKGTPGQQIYLHLENTAPDAQKLVTFNGSWQLVFITGVASATAIMTAFEIWGRGAGGHLPNVTFYLWGAQLEAAPFASSYIPTTTAAVTRNKDVLTYPLTGNFSNTVGSAYFEIQGNAPMAISPDLGYTITTTGVNSSLGFGSRELQYYDGTNFGASGFTLNTLGQNKIAQSWSGANTKLSIAGAISASLAFDGNWDFTDLAIGAGNPTWGSPFAPIRNVRIYAAALTDAQLINITAP